jgi:hypothetical protein
MGLSADGKTFASSFKGVTFYDVDTRAVKTRIPLPLNDTAGTRYAMSADGSTLAILVHAIGPPFTTFKGHQLHVFDTRSKGPAKVSNMTDMDDAFVFDMAFAPGNRFIFMSCGVSSTAKSGDVKTARIIDAQTGAIVHSFIPDVPTKRVSVYQFEPSLDGSSVVTVTNRFARVWTLPTLN